MDSTIKHSAKYLIGIVVFLVMSALYFFMMADGNQQFDSEYVLKLIEDNKSLEIDMATMAIQNKEDQSTIVALQNELTQKNELIESLQLSQMAGGTNAICDESGDMMTAQKSLIETQGKYIACSAALNEHKTQVSELSAANALLSGTAELTEQAIQERDVLQNQLAVMSVEYTALEAQIGTVLNQNEQLVSTLVKLQPLAFTDFSLTPSYCDKEFDDGWACVSSIDIVAKLSYNPAAEMVVRLIDPNGDVVARRTVQGREVNNLQFLSSENTPLLTGDYSVRFEIDNLFDEVVPFELNTINTQASL
jgi:nitrogen fixation-related uncharacterized protein